MCRMNGQGYKRGVRKLDQTPEGPPLKSSAPADPDERKGDGEGMMLDRMVELWVGSLL